MKKNMTRSGSKKQKQAGTVPLKKFKFQPPSPVRVSPVREQNVSILLELKAIKDRVKTITDTYDANGGGDDELLFIGQEMSEVRRRVSDYQQSYVEKDEILSELNEFFRQQLASKLFTQLSADDDKGDAYADVPPELLDDLVHHRFSTVYNYSAQANSKLLNVLQCLADINIIQVKKLAEILQNCTTRCPQLSRDETMSKVANFLSKLNPDISEAIYDKLQDNSQPLQSIASSDRLKPVSSQHHNLDTSKVRKASTWKRYLVSKSENPNKMEATRKREEGKDEPTMSHLRQNFSATNSEDDISAENAIKDQGQELVPSTKKRNMNMYLGFFAELSMRITEEAVLQSMDIQQINAILERFDPMENPLLWETEDDDVPGFQSVTRQTNRIIKEAKDMKEALQLHFSGTHNKWLGESVDEIIAILTSKAQEFSFMAASESQQKSIQTLKKKKFLKKQKGKTNLFDSIPELTAIAENASHQTEDGVQKKTQDKSPRSPQQELPISQTTRVGQQKLSVSQAPALLRKFQQNSLKAPTPKCSAVRSSIAGMYHTEEGKLVTTPNSKLPFQHLRKLVTHTPPAQTHRVSVIQMNRIFEEPDSSNGMTQLIVAPKVPQPTHTVQFQVPSIPTKYAINPLRRVSTFKKPRLSTSISPLSTNNTDLFGGSQLKPSLTKAPTALKGRRVTTYYKAHKTDTITEEDESSPSSSFVLESTNTIKQCMKESTVLGTDSRLKNSLHLPSLSTAHSQLANTELSKSHNTRGIESLKLPTIS